MTLTRASKVEWIAVGLRVMVAVYMVRSVDAAARVLLFYIENIENKENWGLYLAISLAPFIFVALVWIFALKIASILLPGSAPDSELPLVLKRSDIEVLAFRIFGAWLVIHVVPRLVSPAIERWQLRSPFSGELQPMTHLQIATLWVAVVELAIGIFLLVGARRLKGALRRES